MRGCRPRTPLVPSLPLPNLRTAHAVTPIKPSTMRNAKKKAHSERHFRAE